MLRDETYNYTVSVRVALPAAKEKYKDTPEETCDDVSVEAEKEYKDKIEEDFTNYLTQEGAEATPDGYELDDLYEGIFRFDAKVTCGGQCEIYTPLDPFESPSSEDYPDVSEKDLEKFVKQCCKEMGYTLLSVEVERDI